MNRRLFVMATLALALAAPSTAGAATPIGGISWQVATDSGLSASLLSDCILDQGLI